MSIVCSKKAPSVCIVLATFNGASHVRAQVESFRSQTLQPKWLVVSDDGSTDATIQIVKDACKAWENCTLLLFDGPKSGYAANFFNGLAHVPPDADFVSLSDQDDVWLNEKLDRAVKTLTNVQPLSAMTLYGSTTWVCDPNLKKQKLSRVTVVTPGFRHALAQNFAGGNTMVFNRSAMKVIRRALVTPPDVAVHDWWIYQILAGSGATIIYDQEPSLFYRQHEGNMIGDNTGVFAMLKRLREMLRGTYKEWNNRNFEALSDRRQLLTPKALDMLEKTIKGRNGCFPERLTLARDGIVTRQSIMGRIGLWLSLAIKRF